MKSTFFRKSDPVLASLNIEETLAFYTQKLDFRISYEDDSYAIVVRDEIALHFWKCNDPLIPQSTSCYVYVRGIAGLYAEMEVAGVIHPNGQLEDKPYGMREFTILDLYGNLIRFGEESGQRQGN